MECDLGQFVQIYFGQYRGYKVKQCLSVGKFFNEDSEQKKKQKSPKSLSFEYTCQHLTPFSVY